MTLKARVGKDIYMKIGIGSDHAGLDLKNEVARHLRESGYEVEDYGTYTSDSCDYPVYGEKVARAVAKGEVGRGIIICATGIGISISANKVKGIRAALCTGPYMARMSRAHNDSNILALGARVTGIGVAMMTVDAWLETEFEGGRHQRRVDLITAIDEKEHKCI